MAEMAEVGLVDIDKKLSVLIEGFEREMELNKEYRSEHKDLERRVRDTENWINMTKRDHTDFAQVRNSIIKWVVGSMLGISAVGTAVITTLLK